jgi:hypothetical protein
MKCLFIYLLVLIKWTLTVTIIEQQLLQIRLPIPMQVQHQQQQIPQHHHQRRQQLVHHQQSDKVINEHFPNLIHHHEQNDIYVLFHIYGLLSKQNTFIKINHYN